MVNVREAGKNLVWGVCVCMQYNLVLKCVLTMNKALGLIHVTKMHIDMHTDVQKTSKFQYLKGTDPARVMAFAHLLF